MVAQFKNLQQLITELKEFNTHTSVALNRYSWGVLIISACVVLFIAIITLQHQKDFSQDYFAAQAFFEGHNIYSKRVVELGNNFNKRGIPNAHPPSLIMAILPCALLSYSVGFLLFTLFSLFVYVLALSRATHIIGLSPSFRRFIVAGSLLWPATLQSIHQGSISFLIAALMLHGWVNIYKKRDVSAAALLGFGAALKFFPGILIFYFVFHRNWRGCLAFAISFAVMILASVGIFGLESWETYTRTVAPQISQEFSTHYANISLWAYILPLFSIQRYLPPLLDLPLLGSTMAGLCALILLGATIYSHRFPSKTCQDQNDYSYWLWVLCSVLLAPVSWQYSLTFLPIPLVILLRQAITQNRSYLFIGVVVAGICLVLADYDSYSLILKESAPGIPPQSLKLYVLYFLYTKIQVTAVFFICGLLVAMSSVSKPMQSTTYPRS